MTAWDTILSGQILQGIIEANTNVMGNWFYVFIFGMALSIIYFKTHDIVVTALTFMLVMVVAIAKFPNYLLQIIVIFLTFAVASLFFLLFKRVD